MCRSSLYIVFVLTTIAVQCIYGGAPGGTQHHHHEVEGYSLGQRIEFQCFDDRLQRWTAPPVCQETSDSWAIYYGKDGFHYCSWVVSQEEYDRLREVAAAKKSWNCRLRMAPGVELYLPVPIPLWGIVEQDHLPDIHIDNHLNFLLHGEGGILIGATAYSLKDRFQAITPEVVIGLHGNIKFFIGSTFRGFSEHTGYEGDAGFGELTLFFWIMWTIVVFVATMLLAWFIFNQWIRPSIIVKDVKKD